MSIVGIWRSIDSAPLDGTVVLVADCFGVTAAAFDGPPDRAWYEDGVGEKVSDSDWQTELESYTRCWTSVDPISRDTETLRPSHWMPMPMPPAEARGGKREGQSA